MIDRYAVRGLREEAHPALASAEASRRPVSACGREGTHLGRVVWSLAFGERWAEGAVGRLTAYYSEGIAPAGQ